MAAWLHSLGMTVTPESARAALRSHGSWGFYSFISDCKAEATKFSAGVSRDGRIRDHDRFTEICETEARWRRIGGSLAQAAA